MFSILAGGKATQTLPWAIRFRRRRRGCRRRRLDIFMDQPLIGFAELSRDLAD